MVVSVAEQCRACITTLKSIISILSDPQRRKGPVQFEEVTDELERFSLWIGNIGALHPPASSMSLESRLREVEDVQTHILELLRDINEVAHELLTIVSGEREGEVAFIPYDESDRQEEGIHGRDQIEEIELLDEFGASVTRLFRVSKLIREAAPTDLFAKALSRNRYQFNDQYDIAHVGEKFPKLATKSVAWLQKRLGRAITQRRHYLSYIQDHHDRLAGLFSDGNTSEPAAVRQQDHIKLPAAMSPLPDSSSRPSTFFTKASSLAPELVTPRLLATEADPDSEDDTRSYTTITRSVDGDGDLSATFKIPKLVEIQNGSKREFECPFCFRMKKFKNERAWIRHVFSDLRSYVCTFPDCDTPYFGDINEWFRHEMQYHRVCYTCRLCRSKPFTLRQKYLAHILKEHPDTLEDGEEEFVLSIAREPVNQIAAQDCPCCLEWADRLQMLTSSIETPPDTSNQVLLVPPTVFKRHLASHLESLSTFAIPIGSAAEDSVNSNAAIEDNVQVVSRTSSFSALVFDSPPRSSSSASEEPSHGIFSTDVAAKPREVTEVERSEEMPKVEHSEEMPKVERSEEMPRVEHSEEIPKVEHLEQVRPVSWPPFRSLDGYSFREIDKENAPETMKQEGSNWFALFNPNADQRLDIRDFQTLHHKNDVECIKFSRDGRYIATGALRDAQVFDLNAGLAVSLLQHPAVFIDATQRESRINSVCFSPDGRFLATGADDGYLRTWTIETSTILHPLQGYDGAILSVDFSLDGRHLASAGTSHTIRLYDPVTGTLIYNIYVEKSIASVAFSPDGHHFAVGAVDGIVSTWDFHGGYPYQGVAGRGLNRITHDCHTQAVCSVAYSPDGQRLVTGGKDKLVWIFDSEADGQGHHLIIRVVNAHEGAVNSVCWTQSSDWIISGSEDGSVRFLDPDTGVAHMSLESHVSSVTSVAASPADRLFATASRDKTVRIWRY